MLYLIDKPHADVGFRTARAGEDPVVVLIQDGVFLEPDPEIPTFAVEHDLEMRGVTPPEGVETIAYDALVDLLFEHEVKTFI